MYKVAILAMLLTTANPGAAWADRCESVNIAYYHGAEQPLGNIYYERAGIKFWQTNWSADRLLIKNELNEKAMMDELALSLDCDGTVWLYPVEKHRKKDWVKIGRVVTQPTLIETEPKNDSRKDHVQDILIHVILDVIMHCILK